MPMIRSARLLLVIATAVAIVGLSACVSQQQTDPSACAQAAVTLTATLPATGKLQPENLNVCEDQQVTLTVTAERNGAVHLHGYDDQNAEVEVTPGKDSTLAFTANHVGQFVLEFHPADGSDESQVGLLTVNVK
jgi:hypothetical protein